MKQITPNQVTFTAAGYNDKGIELHLAHVDGTPICTVAGAIIPSRETVITVLAQHGFNLRFTR